jgi:NAD(P)-dependent dehydrogenase (short-subunit alcohol dehydrogenase family)
VLLHVAGIRGRRFGDGDLHACESAGWDRVMEINARGAFLANREAAQFMLGQARDHWGNRGAILNVGSVLDRSPAPEHFGTVAYAASKAAVRALTLVSAARYAADGIRFALIEPALVDTPMAARAVGDAALRPYLASKMSLSAGAIGPESVAEAAVYLASNEARAVTGAVLTVDGGWCVSEGHGSERA